MTQDRPKDSFDDQVPPAAGAHSAARLEGSSFADQVDHADSDYSLETLIGPDCEALEALLDAGLDPSRVPQQHRERAQRIASVMHLAGKCPDPGCDELLVEATLARVSARALDPQRLQFSPRDEDALEALVLANMNADKCPNALRERAHRHLAILSSLDVPVPEDSRNQLVQTTLFRVQQTISSERASMQIADAPRARGSWRLSDLVAAAAVLLIASAVLTPMVSAMRSSSMRTGCQAGLSMARVGFAGYANDFADALPLASESRPQTMWWNVGNPKESNSANLFTLVRTGHASTADLACAGNISACRSLPKPTALDWTCADEISYSYQNMFSLQRPRWTQPNTIVVLADRSPVIPKARRGERINPVANSENHDHRGQNVLFNDGHVEWMKTPVLANGDNIWLPRPLEVLFSRLQNPDLADPLKGNEAPESAEDVFLSP